MTSIVRIPVQIIPGGLDKCLKSKVLCCDFCNRRPRALKQISKLIRVKSKE